MITKVKNDSSSLTGRIRHVSWSVIIDLKTLRRLKGRGLQTVKMYWKKKGRKSNKWKSNEYIKMNGFSEKFTRVYNLYDFPRSYDHVSWRIHSRMESKATVESFLSCGAYIYLLANLFSLVWLFSFFFGSFTPETSRVISWKQWDREEVKGWTIATGRKWERERG